MEQPQVDIGATIAYGVMFDPKNSAKARSMDFNQLHSSVSSLFDLLEQRQTDFVLVGGIAVLAYVGGRNTQDIDLLLSRDAVASLPEFAVESENSELLRAYFGELQVDVLLTGKKFFAYIAKQHAGRVMFADREIPCVTPIGLVLLKLYALPSLYRQGQFDKVTIYEGDIEALLASFSIDSDELLQRLTKFLAETDIAELSGILSDLRERIERKKQRFNK